MKVKSYIYIYLASAIIIITLAVLLIKIQLRIPESISNLSIEDITEEKYQNIHYNTLLVDSFIMLNNLAYGDIIDIQRQSTILEIQLKNTNQLGTDYYNNNDNIKSLKLMENGFEIIDDEKNNTIVAKFIIHKSNFVTVPNDVMISLMYKAYNK